MSYSHSAEISHSPSATKCEDNDTDPYELVTVEGCVDILNESPNSMEVLDDDEDHLTYRVVQLNCPDDLGSVSGQSAALSSIISNPMNGQVYIMTGDSISTTVHRPIAPKPLHVVTHTQRKPTENIRETKRKQTHNEIERKRRDKINEWITNLGKMIPETSSMEGKGSTQSKGFILSRACDYISELRLDNAQLLDALKEHDSLITELEIMKQQLDSVKQENAILKQQIQLNS